MSDSHSPARHPAHIVEPEGRPYPPRLHEPRPHPPATSLLDPRSANVPQSIAQQRSLYLGESPGRGHPMHYQSGRPLDPPFGAVHISQNYVYGYPAGVPHYLGSQGGAPGPQLQQAAIITPQPLRQAKPARRTKAHVASACVNCKKAHLSCDVQRPCGRCVASGKQDTCKDVQHKKRGRPRLRDDKEFGRNEETRMASAQLLGVLPQPGPETLSQQSPYAIAPRTAEPFRVLTSNREDDLPRIRPQPAAISTSLSPRIDTFRGTAPVYPIGPNMAYQSIPVAFLDLDLVIQKTNQAFQDLVAFIGDARGKTLAQLLESRQQDVLQQLRSDLRMERDEREPTYMAPITPSGQDPMQPIMQSVSDKDVDRVSHGYTDRPVPLSFRLPNGQYQSLQTQIRLAKASLYFVTLVVHAPPRLAAPPLLTKQLAPPTPIRNSQTMSAPTNAPSREFGVYGLRPASSAGSAPNSPYFNFNSVRTSLPTVSSSSYGGSPSYGYSPTAGPEQGYFTTYQPPSQPGAYPSSYQPASRSNSIASEAQRGTAHPARLEGLQLPPIRTTPALVSPQAQDSGENTRVRRRASPSNPETGPETPEAGKRRRLNIYEVLE